MLIDCMSPRISRPPLISVSQSGAGVSCGGLAVSQGGCMFQLGRSPSVGGSLVIDVEWRSPSGEVQVPSLVRYQLFAYGSDGSAMPVTEPRSLSGVSSSTRITFGSGDLRAVQGTDLRRLAVVEGYYGSGSGQPVVDRESVEFLLSPVPAVSQDAPPPPDDPDPVRVTLKVSRDSMLDPRLYMGVRVSSSAPASVADADVYYDTKYVPPVLSTRFRSASPDAVLGDGTHVSLLCYGVRFLSNDVVVGTLLERLADPALPNGPSVWSLPVCLVSPPAGSVIELVLDGVSLGERDFGHSFVLTLTGPCDLLDVLVDGIKFGTISLAKLHLAGYVAQPDGGASAPSPSFRTHSLEASPVPVHPSASSEPQADSPFSVDLPGPVFSSEGDFGLEDYLLLVEGGVIAWTLSGYSIPLGVRLREGASPDRAMVSLTSPSLLGSVPSSPDEVPSATYSLSLPLSSFPLDGGRYMVPVPVDPDLNVQFVSVLLNWEGDYSSVQRVSVVTDLYEASLAPSQVVSVAEGGRLDNVLMLRGTAEVGYRYPQGSGLPSMDLAVCDSVLEWADPDPSIGRTYGGWFFAVRVFYPDTVQDVSQAVLLLSPPDGGQPASYRVADLNEGPGYFDVWSAIPPDLADSGGRFERVVLVDWAGDGSLVQSFSIQASPEDNVLLPRGHALVGRDEPYANVISLSGGAEVSLLDGSADDDLPSVRLELLEASLPYEMADPSVGRNRDGWWAGFALAIPKDVDTAASRVSYTRSDSPSVLEERSLDDVKDSPELVSVWSPVGDDGSVGRTLSVDWVFTDGRRVRQVVEFYGSQDVIVASEPVSSTIVSPAEFEPSPSFANLSILTGSAVVSAGTNSVPGSFPPPGLSVEVSRASLSYEMADPSIGRSQDGWWFGLRVSIPGNADASRARVAVAQSPDSVDFDTNYLLDDVKDSPDYVNCWVPVTEESLASGSPLGRRYRFDWTGDGAYQYVTVVMPRESLDLVPAGQVRLEAGCPAANVMPVNFRSLAAVSDGTSPDGAPDITLAVDGLSPASAGSRTLLLEVSVPDGVDVGAARWMEVDASGVSAGWVQFPGDGTLPLDLTLGDDPVEGGWMFDWDGTARDLQYVRVSADPSALGLPPLTPAPDVPVVPGGPDEPAVVEPVPSYEVEALAPDEALPPPVFTPSDSAVRVSPSVSVLASLEEMLVSWEIPQADGSPVLYLAVDSYTGTRTELWWDVVNSVPLNQG